MAAKFHCKTCNKFVVQGHTGTFPGHKVQPVQPKGKAPTDAALLARLEAVEAQVTRLEAMLLEALEEEQEQTAPAPAPKLAAPAPAVRPAPAPAQKPALTPAPVGRFVQASGMADKMAPTAPAQKQEQKRPRYLLRRKTRTE